MIDQKTADLMAAFPVLTEKECKDVYIVILEGDRKVFVPAAIYMHIRQSGWNNGVDWGRAHPLPG